MWSFSKIGLTVRKATLNIEQRLIAEQDKNDAEPKERKCLINLGATDIANGIEFDELIQQFIELIETCDEFKIKPYITTILPLSGKSTSNEFAWKIRQFNHFLIETFENVIDLWQSLSRGLSQNMAGLFIS